MALLQKGFMGLFSGRIGNLVGYNINGVQYVRSLPRKRKKPPTSAQKVQRKKFSLMIKFLSPLVPFIRELQSVQKFGKPGYGRIISRNHKQVIGGTYPNFVIDFRQLQISAGSLGIPTSIKVSCDGKGVLNFRWRNDYSYLDHSNPSDRLWLACYDEDEKSWEIMKEAGFRRDENIKINFKRHRTNRLQVYAGFISFDCKRVSNSRYLGMINVL